MTTAGGTRIGHARRAAIEEALRQAGEAGMRLTHLGAAVGIQEEALAWHLHRMPTAYWPRCAIPRRRRIWHIDHQAAADRYLATEARAPVYSKTFHALAADVHRLANQAGGISMDEIMQALHVSVSAAEKALTILKRIGAIVTRRDPAGHHHNCRRHYASGTQLPPDLDRVKPRPQRQRPHVANLKPARVTVGPGITMTPPATSVANGLDGLTLKPGAKVIVVRHQDPRATAAATAQPLFGALPLGRYLDHDSAIARAYGPRPQPTAGR
ncbi:MAG: hypothetical protein IPM99_18945 [Rubrivivax sp.]|nr:hypothetical protein [Rubrivivax sp.]